MTRPSVRIMSYSIVLMMLATATSALADFFNVETEVIPGEPAVILSEDFDDGTISDWALDTSGGLIGLYGQHRVSPPYSLGLEKQPVKKTCSASHVLGNAPTTNKRLYLDVDMMCWDSAGETALYLKLMSNNKDVLTLAFHWGCIEYFDGYWRTICPFTASSSGYHDMWYHVRIVATMNPGYFDIYVTDEDSYHSGAAFGVPFRGSADTIDSIRFQAGWTMMANGGGEAFWVDNLVVMA